MIGNYGQTVLFLFCNNVVVLGEAIMGKGIVLWLLGIPLPIILLLLLFWH
jgi:hypothetical protein